MRRLRGALQNYEEYTLAEEQHAAIISALNLNPKPLVVPFRKARLPDAVLVD